MGKRRPNVHKWARASRHDPGTTQRQRAQSARPSARHSPCRGTTSSSRAHQAAVCPPSRWFCRAQHRPARRSWLLTAAGGYLGGADPGFAENLQALFSFLSLVAGPQVDVQLCDDKIGEQVVVRLVLLQDAPAPVLRRIRTPASCAAIGGLAAAKAQRSTTRTWPR